MGLVGSLIVAEASVPIDPVESLLGIVLIVRGEIVQRLVDAFDQLNHRSLHFGLEHVFARLEPIPVIVFLQRLKERQSFSGKSGSHSPYYLWC